MEGCVVEIELSNIAQASVVMLNIGIAVIGCNFNDRKVNIAFVHQFNKHEINSETFLTQYGHVLRIFARLAKTDPEKAML